MQPIIISPFIRSPRPVSRNSLRSSQSNANDRTTGSNLAHNLPTDTLHFSAGVENQEGILPQAGQGYLPSGLRSPTFSANNIPLPNSRPASQASMRTSDRLHTADTHPAFRHANVTNSDKPEITAEKNELINNAFHSLYSDDSLVRKSALNDLKHLLIPSTFNELDKLVHNPKAIIPMNLPCGGKTLSQLTQHEKNQLINYLQARQMSEKDRGIFDETYNKIIQEMISKFSEHTRGVLQLLRHLHPIMTAGI